MGAATCSAAEGQALIDAGQSRRAIREFTCLIDADPTGVEGYRGRAEAKLLLGRFADAHADYIRLSAIVEPVHPDASTTILGGYDARLAADPRSISALTGAGFARWYFFDYPQAIQVLDRLLEVEPDDVFGTLFRGSSRLLQGVHKDRGVLDLDRAIALAPSSPDVHFFVADAYTYGRFDPQRAFVEATIALDGGLDTSRVQAILAAALSAFGEQLAAASHIATHIDTVTTELVPAAPISVGAIRRFDLVHGRTIAIPIVATAGERIVITTSSHAFYDTIAVLLDADGVPLVGSDDTVKYFAAIDTVAPA
ncbi:MAG TPA: tetratricopeptide repeat protein, partial [Ilumatobacteraceae bacterium]